MIVPIMDGLAYLGGTDVKERTVDEADIGGEGSGVDVVARSGIDQEMVVTKNFLAVLPLWKTLPVVCSDDKHELRLGVGLTQFLQRLDHVGRAGKMHLEVADAKVGPSLNCNSCQLQSCLVAEQTCVALLEGVQRGNKKPQLIHMTLLAKPFAQSDVTCVDGVEGTSEKPHFRLTI